MTPFRLVPPTVKRKLQSDGFGNAAKSGAELLFRRHVGSSIVFPALDYGIIETVSRTDMPSVADDKIDVVSGSDPQPPSYVYKIKDAYLFTQTGLATTSSLEILEESAGEPGYAQQAVMEMVSRELFFGDLPISNLILNNPIDRAETIVTAAPLIPRYPTNYFHWMVETAPKIKQLRNFEQKTGADVTIIVPKNAPPFVRETLSLLNWSPYKICTGDISIYNIQNLILPSYPGRTESEFDWLRDKILTGVRREQRTEDNVEDNVYVSREGAISRRVVNEDEVMEVLSKYGFKRYLLENRTLAENVRLFNGANVVVGPHGAGLTDILFAEDCTLVELFGARLNKAYENLSETLGVRYEPMYCQAASADIWVDVDELERHVSQFVEESRG